MPESDVGAEMHGRHLLEKVALVQMGRPCWEIERARGAAVMSAEIVKAVEVSDTAAAVAWSSVHRA